MLRTSTAHCHCAKLTSKSRGARHGLVFVGMDSQTAPPRLGQRTASVYPDNDGKRVRTSSDRPRLEIAAPPRGRELRGQPVPPPPPGVSVEYYRLQHASAGGRTIGAGRLRTVNREPESVSPRMAPSLLAGRRRGDDIDDDDDGEDDDFAITAAARTGRMADILLAPYLNRTMPDRRGCAASDGHGRLTRHGAAA